jgi:tetratricopeptide (TPR) repeat protein
MDISSIALFLFVLSVLCGLINLFIAVITRKNSADYLINMQNVLRTIFTMTNLPFGILAASICAYEVFRYNDEYTRFLICVIFFIISFFSECLLDKFIIQTDKNKPEHDISNPIFPAVELLNEISKQKSYLLSVINEYNSSFLEKIKNTRINVEETNNIFNKFLNYEKQEDDELSNKIKKCNKIFEQLVNSAEMSNKIIKSLNQKLEASCTALVTVENQERMLKEINLTFTKIFIEQSLDVNVKIQRILDSLGNITYKCANIQNFPKPYKEITDLYSFKIENIFKILDRRKFQMIFEEHMQIGKVCVYTNPLKAIEEINKAIKINSENAESYYYRGMAYQLKETPDFHAALNDFEKALELNPNSNLYIKCIEELKENIIGDKNEKGK